MQAFFFNLQRQVVVAALLALCGVSYAQDVSVFLRDVLRGSPEARIQLEHRISHLSFARLLAEQTLMLNRCRNWRDMRGNPRFDAFSESLLHDMGSMEQGALTVFTVYERLQDATLQEALTDDQIFIIRRIMNSPQYNNFIEFLSFQRAEFEIAKGFEEVNTGEKEIWIAASALTYIRKSKFYPLLISTISAEDRALLNRHDIDNVTPSQQKKIDDAYLKNLIKFFDTQLESTSIIEKLDTETAGLLTMYKALGIEAMRGEALLSARTPVPYRASCKSNNAENCINQEWIKSAIAKNEEISATKYRTAALILREKFSDLCTVNSQ